MTKRRKSDVNINQDIDTKNRLSKLDIEKALEEYLRDKLCHKEAIDLLENNGAIREELIRKKELKSEVKKEVNRVKEEEKIKEEAIKRDIEIENIKKLSKKYPDAKFEIPPRIEIKIKKEKVINIPEAFSIENIYDSKKFWNTNKVKKPTLLELEEYYKKAVDRESRELSIKSLVDLRKRRNELLQSTDWTQLPDITMNQKERLFYRKYRSYLRDKPRDYKDDNIQNWKILSFEEYKQINFPG